MGITTQYLRYIPSTVLGLVGTGNCICFITRFSQTAKYVAVPACERVIVWDTRRQTKVVTLNAEVQGNVTVLKPRPATGGSIDNTHLAVGYTDGSVAVFDLHDGQPLKFTGHQSRVSSLAWDSQGMRAASGSSDGHIVVWDVVSERGIVRLKGHKGSITQIRFFQHQNVMASSSTDSFIRFWDLDTNHCFRTLTGHRAEVWDFVLLRDDTRLVAGSSDAELRVWSLHFNEAPKITTDDMHSDEPSNKKKIIDIKGTVASFDNNQEEEFEDDASKLEIKRLGRVQRSRGDRVCGLHTNGTVVACHGKSAIVDLFLVLPDEEVHAKRMKRLKTSRKKARESGSDVSESEAQQLSDEIRKLPSLRGMNKMVGVDVFSSRNGTVRVAVLHPGNKLSLYPTTLTATENTPAQAMSTIERPGHRTEVRAAAFNSISDQFVTASGDSLKVWQRGEVQCVTSVDCDYALCVVVVPGDRHALVGTRSGRLQLFEIGSAELLEDIQAHQADEETNTDTGIWSLSLTHDSRGFVTGASDKMVKFWKFELVQDESGRAGKRLSFIQDSRALKVADQVTCVRCSSNGRFVAVATLDMKETLYFADTLKLCHELYGKSLPATCMDFSTDGTLVVTGSKDANLRIYGTDFGDMRRLLKNAHQGGVTDVRFVPKTHLMFSCGHDGTIKQWDADNFQRIVTLQGHTGIVRCLAVCPKGAWVVTGGQDRSIRLWERTQEPLVLEEEREEERTKEEDEAGATATQRPVVAGEEGSQAVRPSITTHHTEKAADMILEALSVYREQLEAGPKAKPHYLMQYVYHTSDPLKFVLEVLRRIKSSELEEAILVLNLDRVLELLVVLKGLLVRGWDVELATRVLLAATRPNLPQLLGSAAAAPVIHALAPLLSKKTLELQNLVGFNLAGLQHLKDREEQRSETQLFVEASQKVQKGRQKRKKKERAVKRVLLTI
ncbi:hypothetical protein Pcinc_023437 [Petrolisthes cinctipes]|uniref:Small-subunit processome Utp12 domain-containing protein n=1 Tax=Petrolisthes cinctipes TaxID=88211 RepID=A0AAE1FED6_PETCI|nr:hypothetical protein Pcinc_023437 [Petrolisthes cinctipes]